MNTKHRRWTASHRVWVGICLFLVLCCSSSARAEQAEWTILYYMDADCDLEAPMIQDLKEIIQVGSSKDVNLIGFVDRSPKGKKQYSNVGVGGLDNWDNAKILHFQKSSIEEVEDLGDVNMGDPATLVRFVEKAVAAFPAKKYALVFGNHGASWPGVCVDEGHGNDILTTPELSQALKDLSDTVSKFDMIAFDACLMANFEVGKAIQPYARIMAASEELEPGIGWEHVSLTRRIIGNPGMDGAELGKSIADTYLASYAESSNEDMQNAGMAVTYSVIDLEKLPALEKALNTLAQQMTKAMKEGARATWLKIADARSETEEYGVKGANDDSGVGVRDILDFTHFLREQFPNGPVSEAATGVEAALQDAVLHAVHGEARPNANGLSIFLPKDKDALERQIFITYLETAFGKAGPWIEFLNEYVRIESGDTTAPEVDEVQTSDAEINTEEGANNQHETITVSSSVKADDIETAQFVLAEKKEDAEIILGQWPAHPDANGKLVEHWDGGWFTIKDKDNQLICPVTDMEELEDAKNTYYVEVPVQVQYKDTEEWEDIFLYFYVDFSEGEKMDVEGKFVYAFESGKDGASEVELSDGDKIRPVFVSYDKEGEEHLTASDDPKEFLSMDADAGLTVDYQPVPAGNYQAGFVVEDYSGNVEEEFTPVKID